MHNLHMPFFSAQTCALSLSDTHACPSASSKHHPYAVDCLNLNGSSEKAHLIAASGVWRSCGCHGCTEGQNGAAQGHQGQRDDVPHGRQNCDPAVGVRSKSLLCRQERSVSFPNVSVSITQPVSQYPLSVSRSPQSVSQCLRSVSQYPQSSPFLFVAPFGVITTGTYSREQGPLLSHQACRQADFCCQHLWGSSFAQKQLHEHVHCVQPWMCSTSHLDLCLQDCLLACLLVVTMRSFQSQKVYFNSDMSSLCCKYQQCLRIGKTCYYIVEMPCRLHCHRLRIPEAHVNECTRPQQL